MNKEQIIDEAYENYQNYPLATIHDHRTNLLYKNIGKGWCMLNGRSMASPHPTRHLTKEEFINKCKTDPEFSEQWGLKIEERELSLRERTEILVSRSDHKKDFYDRNGRLIVEEHTLVLDESNIPTKLITITYKDKTIESYE